jgi:hypothetical protein
LRGFAKVRVEELRLTICDVAIHQKGDITWAQPPSRPWVRDGELVIGDDGKVQYSPILEFDNAAVRTAFSRAVVSAVLACDPHTLACPEGVA